MGIDELTPVVSLGGLYFKRDDLFRPYSDLPLSGGKVRQAIALLSAEKDNIINTMGGNVYTATSLSSPQGIIVSKVCKELELNSVVFVGNTSKDSLLKQDIMRNILALGADINCESIMAYNNVLESTINKKRSCGEKFFEVAFGINAGVHKDAILYSVANQVQNIPDNLDLLIVPSGSCIMLSGILLGLQKYNKKVGKVIGIQISGYDRSKIIHSLIGEDYNYVEWELLLSKDYPYSKHVKYKVGDIVLDPLYEGKAYDYMIKYMRGDISGKKVCFWLVGNSTDIRSWKVKDSDIVGNVIERKK